MRGAHSEDDGGEVLRGGGGGAADAAGRAGGADGDVGADQAGANGPERAAAGGHRRFRRPSPYRRPRMFLKCYI